MASIEELLKKQQQLMGSISRTLPNFKKLGQAKMTRAVVQSRMTSLKEKFALCQDLDARILSHHDGKHPEAQLYFADNQFVICEEVVEEALDFMHEVLAKLIGDDSSGDLNVSQRSASSIRPAPQLPRLSVPTFNGAFDRWESFRDRFQSMIIDNKTLSNVERMHYLCSNLSGDASNALTHLAVTDANFDVAWTILTSRYENKRRLINGHLQTLFSLSSLSSETSKDLQMLRDKTNMSVHALRNLGRPVDEWSDILVFLTSQKLDKSSRKAWELQLGDTVDYPTYERLDKFLESRIRAFEAITPSKPEKPSSNTPKSNNKAVASHSTNTTNLSCSICKSSHSLYQCPSFLGYSPSQRFDYVKRENRCINCLGSQHSVKACKSTRSCKTCQKRHHTLLHFTDDSKPCEGESTPSVAPKAVETTNEVASHLLSRVVTPQTTVLLATARVRIYSPSGHFVVARALMDQGSVATLISSNIAQRLRLKKVRRTTRITGIGESKSLSHHVAQIRLAPSAGAQPAFSTVAYIIASLSPYKPKRINSSGQWAHTVGLNLADPTPMSSEPIDIIIGADLYGQLVLDGVRKGADNEPVAQNTSLGWILSGSISSSQPQAVDPVHIHHGTIFEELDLDLRRFWEVEDLPRTPSLSPEEKQCEEHFVATHSRTAEGKYIVRLPFKNGPPIAIGESRSAALSSLNRSEQRLRREPTKSQLYREFLEEYESLGHMTRVTAVDPIPPQTYYIPHQAVFRESSVTTRLRVVFNASCRTTNGISLNEHLLVGPKLQNDIVSVILQWRQFRYVYTADIAKMYRQIAVDDRDVDYQRILWRPSPDEPVSEYRLRTVTYGTASAPFQALRVLKQLAVDEGANFPLAVNVIHNLLYVDDCIFGADSMDLTRRVRDELTALLAKGCFALRKWASNCPALLSDIDPSDHGLACSKELSLDESLKILGVAWNPKADRFQFHVAILQDSGHTKRAVLSCIAKLFDPLGWVAPAVVIAKMFMQRLWLLKYDWDETLPSDLLDQWREYCQQLPYLETISVPRWTGNSVQVAQRELHGFSDASTKAYAAVVYLRLVTEDGIVVVSLLAAKSKVAPIKTLSVPRLELSGALLLARLLSFVSSSLGIQTSQCHCWTDSTITLAWLRQPPSKWKTFIANRVAEIQTLLSSATWRHVPTTENPADVASRGLSPQALANCTLWWSGPAWLTKSPEQWPLSCSLPPEPDLSADERTVLHTDIIRITDSWDFAKRYASWPKLLRVTAYLFRFVHNIRCRHDGTPRKHASPKISRALCPSEVQKAEIFWLKAIQLETFPQELSDLAKNKRVSKTSSIVALNPYLDTDGLIRVGGRLEKADLPTSTKHPVILQSHPLLSLIVSHAHQRTLHGGPLMTLSYLRTEFWILRARTVVRAVLHRCVACAREKAAVAEELMGNLPDVRVNRSTRAFEHTGVDYAGPILVRDAPGRGRKAHKAYIALFVCMTTKAIHLELVSDYSSAAFIACFHRFVSRRGTPNTMYSDNGTNFQGADRELAASYNAVVRDPNFLNKLSIDRITWHFLPPSAPHFGGLWEAGVRSVKHHLKRSIGSHTLTYEEMNTLLCRIEACLNSRPIAGTSDNFDNYSVLTPGHFLTGANLIALPEPSVLHLSENRLSRWQLVQRVAEGFWKFWVSDYLHTLQQRPKWRAAQRLARVGRIVLLRNSCAPPSKWELGRIIDCHPGDDGLTRVVTVKTANSAYKRPITKLCFLPVDLNNDREDEPGMAGGPPS